MTEDVMTTDTDERNARMHGFQEFQTRGEGGALMSDFENVGMSVRFTVYSLPHGYRSLSYRASRLMKRA